MRARTQRIGASCLIKLMMSITFPNLTSWPAFARLATHLAALQARFHRSITMLYLKTFLCSWVANYSHIRSKMNRKAFRSFPSRLILVSRSFRNRSKFLVWKSESSTRASPLTLLFNPLFHRLCATSQPASFTKALTRRLALVATPSICVRIRQCIARTTSGKHWRLKGRPRWAQ